MAIFRVNILYIYKRDILNTSALGNTRVNVLFKPIISLFTKIKREKNFMLNYVTSASPAELARRNTQTGTNQVKTDYTYTPDWMFENSNAGSVGDNIQVGASKTAAVQTETSSEVNTPAESGSKWSDKCDDGKDDGKIGIGSAILHTLKGAGKSIVNTVVGIVTDPKKLLLTAGTVVACVLCPPLAVGLGVAGVAGGLYSGAKAVGQAVDLYKNGGTDAEAKAAFEDIGASALQVGVSALGVKPAKSDESNKRLCNEQCCKKLKNRC